MKNKFIKDLEKHLLLVKNEKDAIKAFIERTTKNEDYDIILTGAGTSESVGNSIYAYLSKKTT